MNWLAIPAVIVFIVIWEIVRALLFDKDAMEETMRPTNRVSTFTRKPKDPEERMSKALTTQAFVIALERCGIAVTPTMQRLWDDAADDIVAAEAELRWRRHPK